MYFKFLNVSLDMLLVAVTEPVEVPATKRLNKFNKLFAFLALYL